MHMIGIKDARRIANLKEDTMQGPAAELQTPVVDPNRPQPTGAGDGGISRTGPGDGNTATTSTDASGSGDPTQVTKTSR
jgi:hypothetical protein